MIKWQFSTNHYYQLRMLTLQQNCFLGCYGLRGIVHEFLENVSLTGYGALGMVLHDY